MRKITDRYETLSNGVKMPVFGLGTYKMDDTQDSVKAIKYAISVGYKHIDTAIYYKNQKIIGKALKEANLNRGDLFITSKVWVNAKTKQDAMVQVEQMLKELDTNYIDLVLIHWPSIYSSEVYKGLEEVYKAGKVKAIGVSNFTIKNLEDFIEKVNIKPMVNQVELNPQYQQKDLIKYCKTKGIKIVSYQTIMRGKVNEFQQLIDVANKYHATPSQVSLQWALQQGILVIPKSVTPSRIYENHNIGNFELDADDFKKIDELDDKTKLDWDPIKTAESWI
ncbi:aldo/keto reductase [[Acholeplasma] multilocale]|uniref:aldo/keto reductase n=1 Tax=[Acholeplasma] multilocale TaxID=264638 RepID=UPI00047D2BD2|nr:aldo/keto reductase [[Acholeplasma] multilocale]